MTLPSPLRRLLLPRDAVIWLVITAGGASVGPWMTCFAGPLTTVTWSLILTWSGASFATRVRRAGQRAETAFRSAGIGRHHRCEIQTRAARWMLIVSVLAATGGGTLLVGPSIEDEWAVSASHGFAVALLAPSSICQARPCG